MPAVWNADDAQQPISDKKHVRNPEKPELRTYQTISSDVHFKYFPSYDTRLYHNYLA